MYICKFMTRPQNLMSFRLKYIDLKLQMKLLPMYDYVTSDTGHLKNTHSLSFAGLPNVDIIHYTIQKITFIISLFSPIKKVLAIFRRVTELI